MNTLQVSPAAIVTCSAWVLSQRDCADAGAPGATLEAFIEACAESLTTWRGWTATDDGPRCPCCKPTP